MDTNSVISNGTKKHGPPKQHGGYWRPFQEAREYARRLGLENQKE